MIPGVLSRNSKRSVEVTDDPGDLMSYFVGASSQTLGTFNVGDHAAWKTAARTFIDKTGYPQNEKTRIGCRNVALRIHGDNGDTQCVTVWGLSRGYFNNLPVLIDLMVADQAIANENEKNKYTRVLDAVARDNDDGSVSVYILYSYVYQDPTYAPYFRSFVRRVTLDIATGDANEDVQTVFTESMEVDLYPVDNLLTVSPDGSMVMIGYDQFQTMHFYTTKADGSAPWKKHEINHSTSAAHNTPRVICWSGHVSNGNPCVLVSRRATDSTNVELVLFEVSPESTLTELWTTLGNGDSSLNDIFLQAGSVVRFDRSYVNEDRTKLAMVYRHYSESDGRVRHVELFGADHPQPWVPGSGNPIAVISTANMITNNPVGYSPEGFHTFVAPNSNYINDPEQGTVSTWDVLPIPDDNRVSNPQGSIGRLRGWTEGYSNRIIEYDIYRQPVVFSEQIQVTLGELNYGFGFELYPNQPVANPIVGSASGQMWVTDAGVFFLGGIKIARPGSAIGVDAIFRCSKGIVLELDIEGFGSFTYDTYGSPKNNSRENVTITPTAAQNAWFDSLTAGTVVNVNLTITSYQSGNVINSIRPVEEIVVDYSGENLVAFTYFEDYEAYLDAFPKLEVYLSDTMERVRTINVGGNPAYTTSLSFSPDGTKLLASWYDTGSPTMVVLYDVATWVVLGVLDTTPLTQYAAVLMPVWTPDSQYVFIAAETKMGVFSGGDLSLVGSVFTLPAFYSTHDISPDQKNLVVATQSGAYIYNSDDFDVLVEGGTKPTLVQTGWVACVKYSPSGSYIGVYMSGSMRVHSAETGLQLATNGQFESLSNNRQDQVFYWVSDTEIRANARQPNSPYNPYIASLAFDGDSLTLSAWASTSTDINKVGAMSAADDFSYTLLSGYSSALLYDSEGNDITLSWMGTSGDVVMASNRFLTYTPPVAGSSPENLMIAIQYVDGWNNYGGTGRVVAVDMDTGDFHDTGIDLTGAPQAVCFSADGSRVAIVQNGEDAIVYDTATFSVVNSAEYSGGTSWFALNGDGSVGVAGFYGGMTRYNMSTGLYLDASDLVVGSSNNWSDGEFSPDGSLFVCRSNKGIHVFETDGWTALLNAYGAGAKTARFSPDGTKLLISSVNNQNNFRMTVLETSGWTVVAGYGSNTAQCSDGEWLDNDNFVIRYNNVTNVCNLSGGVITLSPVTEPAAAEQGNFECLKASPGNGLFVAVYNAASYVYNSAGVLQSYPNLENLDAARLDFNQ